jgi:DNA-binding response OmpR family regulator
MSGFDLCRVLRADHLTSSIPIVVVTSETGADAQRALSAGADSILPKPCSPDALFREIKQLLLKAQILRDETRRARPNQNIREWTPPRCSTMANGRGNA